MNGPLFLRDFGAYSLQIGLLVGVAAGVLVLLRLRAPSARLMYWHMLLLACVVLPLVRPWKQEITVRPASAMLFQNSPALAQTPSAPIQSEFPWSKAAVWVLAGGAVARLMWLGAGLLRLRLYRQRSHPFDTAYDANILISPDISSPVTFGARYPVILVPPQFVELPAAMQQGILCHEILHIERRDWLFTMAEEFIRAIYWFHPAIWWVLGQIHLAREQAVDRRVIELTGARDPYVDALLAMASARPQLDLAPAPLFLRERHLKHRLVELLKEARMSRKRLISGLAVGAVVLAAASWVLTGVIPLTAAPQMVTDSPGVIVNTNGAQLMHRSAIVYPRDAMAKGIQGTVVVQIKLNAEGEVADATVQTGPEELRKGVIQSVLTWHFTKDAGGSTQTIDVNFTLPTAAARAEGSHGRLLPSPTGSWTGLKPGRLIEIQIAGLSDQAKSELLARMPVHVGDTIGPDQVQSAVEAVHKFNQHLEVGALQWETGDIIMKIAPDGEQPFAILGRPLTPKPGRLVEIQITRVSDEVKSELLARIPVHVGDTIGPDQIESVAEVAGEVAHRFDEHLAVWSIHKKSGDIILGIAPPGTPLTANGVEPRPAAEESSGQRISVPAEAAEAKLISRFSDLHAFAANLKPGRLAVIQITGVSDQVKNELLARIPVHVGDTIGSDQFESVVKVVHEFDRHLGVGFGQAKSGDINLKIAAPGDALVREAPTPHAAQESSGQRIVVPAEAAEAKLISRTEPEYPPLARRMKISGTVVLEAVIGKDGRMQSLHLLSGSPMLIPAAMDAAKNWVYKPTVVNGEPVEVATTISVNFALPD